MRTISNETTEQLAAMRKFITKHFNDLLEISIHETKILKHEIALGELGQTIAKAAEDLHPDRLKWLQEMLPEGIGRDSLRLRLLELEKKPTRV